MDTIQHLENNIDQFLKSFEKDLDWSYRYAPGKWSRKEILGHLVDSARYNLERFTEISYKPQPYIVHTYDQDDLVKINAYDAMDSSEVIQLWQVLNQQIIRVLGNIPESTFDYKIILPSGEENTFRFLAEDYVVHMEHHMKQFEHQKKSK